MESAGPRETTIGQVIDTDAARDFMAEALQKIDEEDLVAIVREIEGKHRAFARFLAPERLLAGLSAEDVRRLLRSVFATRRHAEAILADPDAAPRLAAALRELLDHARPIQQRFDAFCASAPLAQQFWATDIASECLHFTYPDHYWLWTRWMWDPVAGTGALPLVTTEGYRFEGATPGDTYLHVGEAVSFVGATVEAAGLTQRARGPFGVDVFLVSVYAVYLYTVLRMRMTQEFNRVVPGLPDLSRRLLGLRALEV
ncbi:MAG: hypothetical protein WEE03_05945 [Chloroflexota bacterium]